MSNVKTITKNSKLKIIFFGNTKYSTIGARIIHSVYPISLIITIPGSPVRHFADQSNIPVLETSKLDHSIIQDLKKVNADFLVVEDYGLILPKELFDLPKYAPLNIHHSLLSKYRGPSPAPFAILNGDKISGVSIIRITEQVDAGDILAQQEYQLAENETTDSLLTKLNDLGGRLMVSVIKQYLEGKQKPVSQDESKVSFTKRFEKKDSYFDINNPPALDILDRMIRAYYPWPGVWTRWSFDSAQDKQAKIVKFYPEGKIQMEGKKVIDLKDFLNGYPDFPIKNLITL